MDRNLIGCSLQWMQELFMPALVVDHMVNGLYSINGMVDDREAMAEVKSSRASSAVAKRQRREREERERRQSEDGRIAKEYAQQVFEWRSVHNYNSNMQRFMENVGQHTGMPSTAIPLPPPPPPPPPTYGISASPNPSQNARTIGSATGEDNLDDTLSRIAQGMFGGYVNASGSAVGNYSPDLDGGLAPF